MQAPLRGNETMDTTDTLNNQNTMNDQDNLTYRELYRAARKAAAAAYAPYSAFHVGAALLTASGTVYTGVNIENASYPVGLCAERSAMAKAVTAGERDFTAIAIYGASEGGEAEPCQPCGMCRQFLYEFAPQLAIVTGADEDHLETALLSDLLPKGFTL